MVARRWTLTAVTLACALLGVLAFGAGPAGAALKRFRVFESAPFSQPEAFGNPSGVAVDQKDGNVYVLDGPNKTVDIYGGEGGPPAGGGPAQIMGVATYYISSVAVDSATDDVYVPAANEHAVDRFKLNASSKQYEKEVFVSGPESYVPNGVAVDTEGHVYVAAGSYSGSYPVIEYSSAGAELARIEPALDPAPEFVAVGAPGTLYVGSFYHTSLLELKVSPAGAIESETLLENGALVAAVDSAGNAYVVDDSVFVYGVAGSLSESFGSGGRSGVAVNEATGDVYYSNGGARDVEAWGAPVVVPDVTSEPPSVSRPTSATLDGTLNPDGIALTSCEFEYGASASYGQTAACNPSYSQIGSVSEPVAVSAGLAGLEPDITYHYRLKATNANGPNYGGDVTFRTPGPGIRDESSTNVSAGAATLDATIDPDKAPTTYYFQYGTSNAYGSEVPVAPGASIGSGEGDVEVSQSVQGLVADTTYHYRIVAVSEWAPGQIESFAGRDQTFTTQPIGAAFQLPDGRAWEMVSPPNKEGQFIYSSFEAVFHGGVTEASVDGGAVSYLANGAIEESPEGSATIMQQIVSRRTASGWLTRDVSPRHERAPGPYIGGGGEYRFFSTDLSHAIVEPFGLIGSTRLSEHASERTPYLRTDSSCTVSEAPSSECYRPLVVGCPAAGESCPAAVEAFADVPPGTEFGQEGTSTAQEGPAFGRAVFVGATPDARHVLISSTVALTGTPIHEKELYEWSDGKLTLVSLLPEAEGGEPAARAPVQSLRDAISSDGSRIVWAASSSGEEEGAGVGHLYLRDTARGETVRLDAVRPGVGGPDLLGISADGSRVLFSEGKLTDESGTKDLYECRITEEAGKLACALSDLTPRSAKGEAGEVTALGMSEDGEYVYFVAAGALAPGASSGSCSNTPFSFEAEQDCNLYVRHAGTTTFIAALASKTDLPDWAINLNARMVRVSPNGRWLEFMSNRRLTGYDTRDAQTGRPDEEVYLYHAAAAGGEGRLVCASCDPTGARPVGGEREGSNAMQLVGDMFGGGVAVSANVPHWTAYGHFIGIEGDTLYQPRYLSNSGRLFFNSIDALAPQDVNGNWDVYEYEPVGVPKGSEHECTSSSPTYSERSGGCVALISAGTSFEESAFLDASESGGDVFFLTSAKLTPQDVDGAIDVYDAHECTQGSPCVAAPAASPPPCTTSDACRAAPAPQPSAFGAPPSATFSGEGNLSPSASRHVAHRGKNRARRHRRRHRHRRGRRNSRRPNANRRRGR